MTEEGKDQGSSFCFQVFGGVNISPSSSAHLGGYSAVAKTRVGREIGIRRKRKNTKKGRNSRVDKDMSSSRANQLPLYKQTNTINRCLPDEAVCLHKGQFSPEIQSYGTHASSNIHCTLLKSQTSNLRAGNGRDRSSFGDTAN